MKVLTMDDIDERHKKDIYVQDYSSGTKIDGVKLIEIHSIVGEDGMFSEILRIADGEVEGLHSFRLLQVNRTEMLGESIKAWHLHLKQNELWYVNPESHMLIGLVDLRKDSPTKGAIMRLALGASRSHLLLIPNGVAHGSANMLQSTAYVWYFMDQYFDHDHPDELRLPWDTFGADFWNPKRD
ncbi:dTDP-4-dehydrorhamnose 3,5-epimerase family protein [Candidatus Gottesmanbacteria bacterium]|nr:dTDP-4-dehydrorhamnose 3,5-epimerase family protein [Candidatus Gottesmanbacteria bacterium]